MNEGITVYELYDPIKPSWWQIPSWWIIICSTCVLLLIFLVLVIWNHRRRTQRVPTAWEKALSDLRLVQLDSANEIKERYRNVVIILKKYFTIRYGTHLESLTDEELLIYLKKIGFPSDLFIRVERICTHAHEARFAQQPISEDQLISDLDRSIEVIRNSIPKPTT